MKTIIGTFSANTYNAIFMSTGINSVDYLKRAAILFDKLLLFTPVLTKQEFFNKNARDHYFYQMGGEPICKSKSYQDIFLTLDDITDSRNEIQEEVLHIARNEIIPKINFDNILLKWNIPFKKLGKSNVGYYSSEGINKTLSEKDVDIWTHHFLHTQKYSVVDIISPQVLEKYFYKLSFSGLFSEIHEFIIREVFLQTVSANPDAIIKKLSNVEYIDFTKLGWEKIIELRHSDFIKDFRKKIYEWTSNINTYDDPNKFSENLKKYIADLKFEIIDKSQPKLKFTTFKSLLGLLPIPFINPISLLSSYSEIKNEYEKKKKYSWLYFIQEVKKNNN